MHIRMQLLSARRQYKRSCFLFVVGIKDQKQESFASSDIIGCWFDHGMSAEKVALRASNLLISTVSDLIALTEPGRPSITSVDHTMGVDDNILLASSHDAGLEKVSKRACGPAFPVRNECTCICQT